MPCSGSRKCLNCDQYFIPHPRSKGRQRFCSEADCRQASKQYSQRKWLNKPENRDYFCGPDHVRRVQRWRKKTPGYWISQRSRPDTLPPLQDPLLAQQADIIEEKGLFTVSALQDVLITQPFVLLGLIAQLTGTLLQDDIADTLQRLQQLGEDLLHSPHPGGPPHADVILTQSTTPSAGARPVQLGRSAPGT